MGLSGINVMYLDHGIPLLLSLFTLCNPYFMFAELVSIVLSIMLVPSSGEN